MADTERFFAIPNRRARLTGTELEELFAAATDHPHVDEIARKRTNVAFRATPEALADLRALFGDRLIIEPDRPLSPLRP